MRRLQRGDCHVCPTPSAENGFDRLLVVPPPAPLLGATVDARNSVGGDPDPLGRHPTGRSASLVFCPSVSHDGLPAGSACDGRLPPLTHTRNRRKRRHRRFRRHRRHHRQNNGTGVVPFVSPATDPPHRRGPGVMAGRGRVVHPRQIAGKRKPPGYGRGVGATARTSSHHTILPPPGSPGPASTRDHSNPEMVPPPGRGYQY